MSIPLLFEPVSFKEPKTDREHVIVGGGMLSNFPVWLFDAEEPSVGPPSGPTEGIQREERLRRGWILIYLARCWMSLR